MTEVSKENEKTKLSKILGSIKEFKELIAVIVFFVSGILWVFGYFATKDQLKSLHCITNANMEFLQGQMDSNTLSGMLLKNLQEQNRIKNTIPEGSPERAYLVQLEIAANDLAVKSNIANEMRTDALKVLKSGKCNGN